MSASPAWQQHAKKANISAVFVFMPHHTYDWLESLKRVIQNPSPSSLMRALTQLHRVAEGVWLLARHGIIYRRWATPHLTVMCEQPPSSSSYIALSKEKDCFDQQLAQLHWTLDPIVADTIRSFTQVVSSELERLGICKINIVPVVNASNEALLHATSDVNHHMGGARMSRDPDSGVVDSWMRVWGVDNLFVCSAAVFPSSSHSNPTLTLLALISRLVDRLRQIDDFDTLKTSL